MPDLGRAWQKLHPLLQRRLAIDARALALLRMALGTLLVVDLLLRVPDLTAFYTDQGILPRDRLGTYYPLFPWLSLHMLSGGAWWQVSLFLVAAAAAASMALGLRTRTATVVSFLLLVSLAVRNPLVLDSGDSLLVLLLFWCMFLPLGSCWSVDASRRARHLAVPVVDVAGAGLLVQVVLVYWVNAVFKARGGYWTNGEAMQYVFRLDYFTTELGAALAAAPGLLVFLSKAWFVLLWLSPLLLLATGVWRAALAALFMAGHVGMMLTIPLGIFPWISLAALLVFLPPVVWDRLSSWLGRRAQSPAPSAPTDAPRTARVPSAARRTRSTILGALVVTTLLLNASSLGYVTFPGALQEAAAPHAKGWAMFARPPRAEHWIVAPTIDADGQAWDALNGREPDLTEPPPLLGIRWRNYLLDMRRWGEHESAMMLDLADHLCHSHPITNVTVLHVMRPTVLQGDPPPAYVADRVSLDC